MYIYLNSKLMMKREWYQLYHIGVDSFFATHQKLYTVLLLFIIRNQQPVSSLRPPKLNEIMYKYYTVRYVLHLFFFTLITTRFFFCFVYIGFILFHFFLHSGAVRFHLALVPFLVFGGLVVPVFGFLVGQGLVLGRNDLSDVTEGRVGILLLDGRTDVNRKQKVRGHVPFRRVRILFGLFAFPTSATAAGTVGSVPLRRYVPFHLLLVPDLVLFDLLLKLFHLGIGQRLVLLRQNPGDVPETRFRMFRLHVGPFRLRVDE